MDKYSITDIDGYTYRFWFTDLIYRKMERIKPINNSDIVTGEPKDIIEDRKTNVNMIIINRNDDITPIEKLKYRAKTYISPYAKFDKIRKRK